MSSDTVDSKAAGGPPAEEISKVRSCFAFLSERAVKGVVVEVVGHRRHGPVSGVPAFMTR